MAYEVLKMKTKADELNDYTFTFYYYRLKLLILSLHEWDGLPNFIKSKWIEKYLIENGECMYFDSAYGNMVAKLTKVDLNAYDEPILLYPNATNYVDSKAYENGKEAVLIQNNDLGLSCEHEIIMFAQRLAEITRAQDVNINAQKTPILILCNDKQKLTMKNVYAQYKGNEPVIFGAKTGEFDGITAIKTDAPIVFDKLQLQKHQVLNEFLTFFGINNANQDKKERLVADEVSANNDSVMCFAETMLKARKQACEEINRIFGTNISVRRKKLNIEDLRALIEDTNLLNDSEGSSEKEVI